jgi:hypothetical protein
MRNIYVQLRSLGLSDETAQAVMRPTREKNQEEQKAQVKHSAWKREVDALVPTFRDAAHYWMRTSGGGCFTAVDVERKAHEFAEQEVHSRQKPKLLEREPKQLTGPTPAKAHNRAQPDAAPGQREPAALQFVHQNISQLGQLKGRHDDV